MICEKCGKPTPRSYAGMCQGCYKYFHAGGKIHPLPPHGRVVHDEHGRVICHICGRSYTRLGSHIKESHGMTIDEYKSEFGLCASAKTTEKSYSATMHDHAVRNKMPERLLAAGEKTRIKKGDTHMRKGKKTRLQETLAKKERKRTP